MTPSSVTPSALRSNPFEGFTVGDLGIAVDESTRSFMIRVYLWMTLGVFLSGVVAFKGAANPTIIGIIEGGCVPLVILSLIVYFLFDAIIDHAGGFSVGIMFFAYAVLNGLLLSSVFYEFELGSIGQAFFITAGAFVALSLYATFAERDLTPLAGFIVMGLFGIIVTGFVNLAVQSPRLGFVTCAATVLVAAALTAVTTQFFRSYHEQRQGESSSTISIKAALTLYMCFVTFFVALVRLTARSRT